MTIRYVANARFPTEKAYGVHLAKMCEALGALRDTARNTAKGFDVELIVPTKNNPDLKTQDAFAFYSLSRTFRITWLKTPDLYWLIKLPGSIYTKLQILLFIRSLQHYWRDNLKLADIIYTRDEYLLPYLASYANRTISEVHNVPSRAEYYSKFWNQCRCVVAINNGVREDLIKAGVKRSKIEVLPDAVDVKMFDIKISTKQAREKVNLPLDKKIILTNSSLYPWKGVDLLLEAATSPLAKGWLFVFVGGPDNEVRRFKQKAAAMQLANVLITGHQLYELIPYYLKTADVLVLPASVNNKEKTNFNVKYTSPLKAFEYLASGRPIVVADVPAVREIINNQQALFYQPDSAENLAKAIQAAISLKPELIANLKQLSWHHRAEQILNLLK